MTLALKRSSLLLLAFLIAMAAAQEQTMIRLAHLSPNIPEVNVHLLQAPPPAPAAETTEVAPAEPAWQEVAVIEGLRYGSITDYQVLAAGTYRVQLVPVGETEAITERELRLGNGNYYTVSAIGLRLVGMEDVEASAGGFMAWLQGLFGGEDPRDPEVLRLRVEAFEDRPSAFAPAGQAHVRVVHAAPGTTAVQLWAMRGGETASSPNVSYGQVGNYQAVPAGSLQLDVLEVGADTPATLYSTEMDFEVGHLYTVFLVGTQIEAVPFAVVVTTDASLGGGAEAELEGAPGAEPRVEQEVEPEEEAEEEEEEALEEEGDEPEDEEEGEN